MAAPANPVVASSSTPGTSGTVAPSSPTTDSTGSGLPLATTSLSGEGLQLFREIVTATISIAILSVSLWMMVDTYKFGSVVARSNAVDDKQLPAAPSSANRQSGATITTHDQEDRAAAEADDKRAEADVKARSDAFGREKDLLLYALALLGTVTGYYLGRVPAEARAQQAQQTASNSQNQLASAQGLLGNANMAVTQAATRVTQATATLATVRSLLATADSPRTEAFAAETIVPPEQKAVHDAQMEIDKFFQKTREGSA
jgi:hypothetical protein